MRDTHAGAIPGHVRRKLGSDGYTAFVEVPEAPRDASAAPPSRALLRIVEMAMLGLVHAPVAIEGLPYAARAGEDAGLPAGIRIRATRDGDGIRLGVTHPTTGPFEVPGILLRHAPDPHGSLFTLSGRGAVGTMACNGPVASHAISTALGRMCDELAWPLRGGPSRLAAIPGVYGSLFDEAFPEWEPFTGVARDAAEEPVPAPGF